MPERLCTPDEGLGAQSTIIAQYCQPAGQDCHPIKMVGAFVGYYGSFLEPTKEDQFGPEALPERDIYFCGDQVCAEGSPGAVSSGWLGPNN